MSDQPEALLLADALDNTLVYGMRGRCAAAELRRQHTEIKTLKATLSKLEWRCRELLDEIVTLS